ncbi:hypothetical protein C8R47DRAFT_1276176 [Mycena vitilis]|nr:hypothetical protein C8R47DRAFT_1276176 [Mycena vitilis]
MPICGDCSLDFYLLDKPTCFKCMQLEGKSEPEKDTIRRKNQCRCCSVVFQNLPDSLCQSCCNAFAKADSIPRVIMDLQGAVDQIQSHQTSDLTSEIWELAKGYKQIASDTRLGLPRTLNSNLQKTPAGAANVLRRAAPGVAKGPSLAKGSTRVQEMKDKREQGTKVKIVISMAISAETATGKAKAPQAVQVVRLVHIAKETDPVYETLDTVVGLVSDCYTKHFPAAAKIKRQMVSFHAVETSTKFYALPGKATTEGTVADLLLHFVESQHISKAQYEAKHLEVKLILAAKELFPDQYGESVGLSSKSRRPSSARSSTASSSSRSNTNTSQAPPPRRSQGLRASAWRRPTVEPHYARNPSGFIEYKFTRFKVELDGTSVVFTSEKDAKVEKILVASDWREARAKKEKGEPTHNTGFIGSGSSKNVVYARLGTHEYALAQAQDINLPESAHAEMLRDEMRNLALGEMIRKEFFSCAEDCSVQMPEFRFNVDGAILGLLEPLPSDHISKPLGLPFLNFLATPYLPCGPVDVAIQKFTGNADCGEAPKDELTQAIHAFTHFTMVYTRKDLVFCDLQGLYNRQGTMMLVDPQSHSAESNRNKRMYWDGGPEAVTHFLDHHLKSCGNNYICNGIEIASLEFDYGDSLEDVAGARQEQQGWNDNDEDSDSDTFSKRRARSVSHSPNRLRKKSKSTPESPTPPARSGPRQPYRHVSFAPAPFITQPRSMLDVASDTGIQLAHKQKLREGCT